VKLYRVGLGITDPREPAGSAWLIQPNLLVMELVSVLPTVDALIGLDILRECKLFLGGPAGRFTLEF